MDLKPGEVQPWAKALVERRMEDLGIDHMSHLCLPWGPNYSTSQRRAKIVQTPGLILILDEDLTYRQIYLDGRPVRDQTAIRAGWDIQWADGRVTRWWSRVSDSTTGPGWMQIGHPHTEALRMTERYRRTDFGHMDIEVTLSDPGNVHPAVDRAAPCGVDRGYRTARDGLQREPLPTRALDRQGLRRSEVAGKVAPDVLEKYAGTYQELDLWGPGPHPRMITITVSDGALFAELKGRGKTQLVAQSETQVLRIFWTGNHVRPGRPGQADASPRDARVGQLPVLTHAVAAGPAAQADFHLHVVDSLQLTERGR